MKRSKFIMKSSTREYILQDNFIMKKSIPNLLCLLHPTPLFIQWCIMLAQMYTTPRRSWDGPILYYIDWFRIILWFNASLSARLICLCLTHRLQLLRYCCLLAYGRTLLTIVRITLLLITSYITPYFEKTLYE